MYMYISYCSCHSYRINEKCCVTGAGVQRAASSSGGGALVTHVARFPEGFPEGFANGCSEGFAKGSAEDYRAHNDKIYRSKNKSIELYEIYNIKS